MKKIFLLCLLVLGFQAEANEGAVTMMKAPINLKDQASLQRGARTYMNYCGGCHSLQYMRYNRMAKDIGITDPDGNVAADIVTKNLIFTGEHIGDTIQTAMPKDAGERWFGKAPPDLTLSARVRGSDWLYTYLHSFYRDDKSPWGSNNRLFPDVAMPNILFPLQGDQVPIYRKEILHVDGEPKEVEVIDHLATVSSGLLTEHQFDLVAADLVNFLSYTAEPIQLDRKKIGLWVLLFLVIFLVPVYLLKKEYWKDID